MSIFVKNFTVQYNCNLIKRSLESSEAHTEVMQTLGFLVPMCDVYMGGRTREIHDKKKGVKIDLAKHDRLYGWPLYKMVEHTRIMFTDVQGQPMRVRP